MYFLPVVLLENIMFQIFACRTDIRLNSNRTVEIHHQRLYSVKRILNNIQCKMSECLYLNNFHVKSLNNLLFALFSLGLLVAALSVFEHILMHLR